MTSFLTSLPKYHEFQLSFIKNSTSQSLSQKINETLEEKLSVLESHKCGEYVSVSSPKIKVLILERKIDQMSPLLYSYHYGAITQEMELFTNVNSKFTVHSNLYKTLFPLDIQEASDKI